MEKSKIYYRIINNIRVGITETNTSYAKITVTVDNQIRIKINHSWGYQKASRMIEKMILFGLSALKEERTHTMRGNIHPDDHRRDIRFQNGRRSKEKVYLRVGI